VTAKPSIPWYYWPFWFVVLAAGLFVFYVLLTPVWIGIRLVSWFAERRNHAAAEDQAKAGPSSADRAGI
jgi:hypothetical protein